MTSEIVPLSRGFARWITEKREGLSTDQERKAERALLSLIAQGDYANANQLLNELLGFVLFASGRDMGLTKARILELVVLMSRAALEGGASVEAISVSDLGTAQAYRPAGSLFKGGVRPAASGDYKAWTPGS